MRLRLIPAGSFKMGSTKGAADERPVETITLEKPFCLGVC
jgi:formylglycine-generating enzyme required for sulfatase activity